MAASFSFGSFGDIITTAQLVWRLAQALSDSRGSAPQFRDLVTELHLFYGAMNELMKFWQSRAQTAELKRLTLEIQQVADDCRREIESFLDKGLKRYGKSFLKPKDAPKSIGDRVKRVLWASLEKEDVAKLRDRLQRNKNTVDMIQSVAQGISQEHSSAAVISRLAELEAANKEASTRVDKDFGDVIRALRKQEVLMTRVDANIAALLSNGQSTRTQLTNIERDMALLPSIQATLNTSNDNYALIEDALGYLFRIPLEIHPSWETVHSMISDQFKNRPGNQIVSLRNYVIQDPTTKSDLQLSVEFHSLVRPGQRLNMAMVFQGSAQSSLGEHGGLGDVCTKCGLSTMLLGSDEIDVSCTNPQCGFTYREIVDFSESSVNEIKDWLVARGLRSDDNDHYDSPSEFDSPNGDDIARILFRRQASDGPEIFKRIKFLSSWEDRAESRGEHWNIEIDGVHFWSLGEAGWTPEIDYQLTMMTGSHLQKAPIPEPYQVPSNPILPDDRYIFSRVFAGYQKRTSVPVIILWCENSQDRKHLVNWMRKLQIIKSGRIRFITLHPLLRRSKEEWQKVWNDIPFFDEAKMRRKSMLGAVVS